MKKFESWLVNIFAYHLTLLRTDRISKENVEISVRTLGMVTATFPLFLVYWVGFLLLTTWFAWESLRLSFILVAAVTVFGGSSVVDKMYFRNTDQIERLAKEMKQDGKKGIWFAGKRLLKFHGMTTAVAFGIYFLAKEIF